MNGADALLRPIRLRETTMDCYHGVELAPTTLESLVTWDVSGHAQRERDRLNAASRTPRVLHGDY